MILTSLGVALIVSIFSSYIICADGLPPHNVGCYLVNVPLYFILVTIFSIFIALVLSKTNLNNLLKVIILLTLSAVFVTGVKLLINVSINNP